MSSAVRTRTLSRLGLLGAAAVAAYVFESLLPMPVPWARVGLSNVFVLVALFGMGFRGALAVNLVRILAGNLLLGILLSPASVLSLAGSTAALVVMTGARHGLVPPLSVVGTSCLGASTNNVVQAMLFTSLLSGSGLMPGLIGVFLLLGVAVGLVTGFIAAGILSKVSLESSESVG